MKKLLTLLFMSIFCFSSGFVYGEVCGDSLLDPGEQCDDGNTVSGDGCSSTCTIEAGWVCTLPIPPDNSVEPPTPPIPSVCIDCSFDLDPPSLTCPGTQTQPLTINCAAILINYTGLAEVSDNCDPFPTVTQTPAPGTPIAGNTEVIIIAVDAANYGASCSFTVNVYDGTVPDFMCPASNPDVVVNANGIGTLPANIGDGSSTDDCSSPVVETSPELTFTCDDIGQQSVILRATNAIGTWAEGPCFFNVTYDVEQTNVAATTCAPDEEGVTQQTLTNQFGCDSLVITTTTLLPQPTVEAGSCEVVFPAYGPEACVDLTAVGGDGVGPYSFVWSPGGQTTPVITVCPTENTTYSAVVTDANGCTAEDKVEVQSIDISCKNNKVIICHRANNRSLCVNIDAVDGHLNHGDNLGPCGTEPCVGNDRAASSNLSDAGLTRAALEEGELILYPNPASTEVTLQFGGLATDVLDLTIYDINGKAVHAEQYNGVQGLNQLTLGVSQLPEGMYIIQLNNADVRYQQKFIKSN